MRYPPLLACLILGSNPYLIRADETRPASETQPNVPAAGHSLHGEAFDEGPRQRAILLSGMGKVHFPVTTHSAQAQAFVEQGVAQLHTFYYLEAERSFRQAALLDRDCVMAVWGLAMANTNNPKRAKAFLQQAQTRARQVILSARERLYLEALAARYSDSGDDKSRRQAWLNGLESIVQEHPDDLNARAWLAMVSWENAGKGDGIGSRQAVEELIRSIERVDPEHPGLHHYRIHLWDGVKPAMAAKSAGLYGAMAPGIAHAWHMPGHTYTGLKRYAAAAYQQEASARVDHFAMARDRTMPFEIHNYAHNNQWFCTSASHIGRVRDGIAVARNLVEQPRDPQKNQKDDGGSPQRSGRARWSELLVRYELWDDLITATESESLDWSDLLSERKDRHTTLGLAHAHKGDRERLTREIEALTRLGEPDPMPPVDPGKPELVGPPRPERIPKSGDAKVPGLDAALAELNGHLALLDGRNDEAVARFEKAHAMRPEARARALLRAGKTDQAIEKARQAVDQNPDQMPPLATLVEILHAAGRTAEAQAAYQRLQPFLAQADRDLPVIRRLDAIVAGWRTQGGWSLAPIEPSASSEPEPKRIDLDRLGPLVWSPTEAPPLALADAHGKLWDLTQHRGRNVIVLFFLGGQCSHCLEQLKAFGKAFEEFRTQGTDLIAVSTDDVTATQALLATPDAAAFPMPLLPDPTLGWFRAYRVFDDFEHQPLHGAFLIDGQGKVRFQRISADPFLDVEFLKREAARVRRLVP